MMVMIRPVDFDFPSSKVFVLAEDNLAMGIDLVSNHRCSPQFYTEYGGAPNPGRVR